MILKGQQRANPVELAIHLMKNENEHVRIIEMRGFACDNLMDAFMEIEAISRATKCEKYLYSLNLDPPKGADVSDELYLDASDQAEAALGLDNQARVVVEHIKNGRSHCHTVWSRLHVDTMKAIKLNFPKRKLNALSLQLFIDHGWSIPAGYLPGQEADPMNYTYAEYQEAKRGSRDPKHLKQQIKTSWLASDNLQSFETALERNGLFLAQGDRRGFVAVDYDGKVYSLSRFTGAKTKELIERLGEPVTLRTVQETQSFVATRMTPKIREYVEEVKEAAISDLKEFKAQKEEMAQRHRQQREHMLAVQDERWILEIEQRAARFSTGIKGLWHRITGKHQQIMEENKADAQRSHQRDKREFDELQKRQAQHSQQLEKHIQAAKEKYNSELDSLYSKLADYATMTENAAELEQRIQNIKMEEEQSNGYCNGPDF